MATGNKRNATEGITVGKLLFGAFFLVWLPLAYYLWTVLTDKGWNPALAAVTLLVVSTFVHSVPYKIRQREIHAWDAARQRKDY